MKKIKTYLKHQRGQKRVFGNFGVVEFDREGVAEISNEAAEYIVKNHPKIVFDGDPEPESEAKKADPLQGNYQAIKEKAEDLQNEVVRKQMLIDKLKEEKNLLNRDLDTWKALVDDLKKEIENLKTSLGNKLDSEKSGKKEEKETGNADFFSMKKDDLIEICEGSELPKSEWESLSRAKLIKYLNEKLNG